MRLGLVLYLFAHTAAAETPPRAAFALIVGVNQSVDRDQPSLHYADDDAVLYFELFRALGARTYLLTRLDDETRRLHPQAAAEASPPTDASLQRSFALLAADLRRARAERVETELYVIYAGHGNIQDGQGYIALEDRRMFGRDIDRLFADAGSDQKHLIVDACYSFFLAYDRGPGGRRRMLARAERLPALPLREDIGLLLSTSSARESHEWEGFQAGVFSYEVRSGLYGAADVDGDGEVTYREIAAFVDRANAPIPNVRFRPEVYARPPRRSTRLLDLTPALDRHVELPHGGHYLLENAEGVRLVELHRAGSNPVRLVRPLASQVLFLHQTDSDEEYRLPVGTVKVAELEPTPARTRARGAAHEAFNSIFSVPFDVQAVTAYRFSATPDFSRFERIERRKARMSALGWTGLALGAGSLAAGIGLTLSAHELSGVSQAEVVRKNDEIDRRNLAAGLLYGTAGAMAITGTLLLLLPKLPRFSLAIGPSGAGVAFSRAF